MRIIRTGFPLGAGSLALLSASLLAACASPPQAQQGSVTGGGSAAELGCTLRSHCVNSLGVGSLNPLRYEGSPAQALTTLQSTVATFAEAQVISSEPLAMVVIFTTPAGFRDEVDFRIDAAAQRIHFRSRSLFGLFDFGKNRSRMEAFSVRFEQQRRATQHTGSPA